jgi:hypothetical protein
VGVEPLHVELVALGGVVRRALDGDLEAGMGRLEAPDLAGEDFPFGSERAAGEGEGLLVAPGAGGAQQSGQEERHEERSETHGLPRIGSEMRARAAGRATWNLSRLAEVSFRAWKSFGPGQKALWGDPEA